MWSVARIPVTVILVCLLTVLPSLGGTDIQVSQNPNPSQVENEPSITINKHFGGDLLNVVAAYNDIGNALGISWSPDSGKTWTDTQLPFVWAWTGDPSIASDHNGILYACFLSYVGTTFYGQSGIFVCRSYDGGRNWTPPVAVDSLDFNAVGSPVPFADKCMMTVDTFSTSVYRGNIYVGWQRDNTNGQNSDVYFARSTNGGISFSAPLKINDAPLGFTFSEGAFPFVGADGDVYFAWYDCYFHGHVPGIMYVDKSTNGGATFGTDIPVTGFLAPPRYTAANTGFAAKCFPSATGDPTNPDRLYLTYISDPDGYFDRRLDGGNRPGTSMSDRPDVVRSGSWVYCAWQDSRNGNSDIYFNRSSDNGATWWNAANGPVDNSTAPGSAQSLNPKLAVSGNNVYCVWEDYRFGPTNGEIFFGRSFDNGQVWQMERDLDMSPAFNSANPVIAAIGSYVYVAWNDNRNGADDIYFTFSADNGLNWSMPQRIDLGDAAGSTFSYYPRLTCTGNYVYCLWRDGRTGLTRPYFNFSANNGTTWQPASVNLSSALGAISSDLPFRGGLECTGTHVYAPWLDNRSGKFQVFFNASHNNGVTWGNERPVSSAPVLGTDCQYPSMAFSGNYVYVGWIDDRLLMGSLLNDCYFDYSSDNGNTWQAADIGPLNPTRVGFGTYWMNLRAEGNYVYAIWLGNDPLVGMQRGNIFFARSSNNGQTWSPDVKVSHGTYQPVPIPWQFVPTFTAGNNWVNAVWADPRYNGAPNIYTNYSTDNGATWLAGLDEADVYLTHSTDGGATWSTPVTVNDDASTRAQVIPWVAVKANGLVDVTYYDFAPLVGWVGGQVRLGVSVDGGVSFLPTQAIQDLIIQSYTQWIGEYNGMAVLDNLLYTIFTDLSQTGNSDIFLDRTANPAPDSDGDGLSDTEEAAIGSDPADADSDNDGVDDYTEVFLYGGPVTNPADTDGDGSPNVTDPDDDGDGINSIDEDTNGNGSPTDDDIDADGKPNYVDIESDGDGVNDDTDNCPFVVNPGQEDSDGDGIGDACDTGSCCAGRVGDANGSGETPPDEVTLGDIMLMVDVKFISGDCTKLSCVPEADANQDGGASPTCEDHVTLGDIMTLVDFLFITGPEHATLPNCL